MEKKISFKKFVDEALWSGDVETKWHPEEGFFKKGADAIASGLKAKSKDLKQAMARLNFYINRAGGNMSSEDKSRLESAKKKLSALYGKNESVNEAGEQVYAKNVTGQPFKDKGGVEYTVMSIQPDPNYGVSINLVPKGGITTFVVHGWDNFAKNFFPLTSQGQYATKYQKESVNEELMKDKECPFCGAKGKVNSQTTNPKVPQFFCGACKEKWNKSDEGMEYEGMEHIDSKAAQAILGSISKKFDSVEKFKDAIDKDPKYKQIHGKTKGADLDAIYKKAHEKNESVVAEEVVGINTLAAAESMLRAHGIGWSEKQDYLDKVVWKDKFGKPVAQWLKSYGVIKMGDILMGTAY